MREVKRMAKPGEYIKLIKKNYTFYEVGDILKVAGIDGELVYVLGKNYSLDTDDDYEKWFYLEDEYVVLENYKGEKDMKKSDLTNGAIVETRNGGKYILIDKILVNIKTCGYLKLNDYKEDLTDKEENKWDIIKVCQSNHIYCDFSDHILKEDENNWTWIREEETVMTISEIEEKLGITGLKIKKED